MVTVGSMYLHVATRPVLLALRERCHRVTVIVLMSKGYLSQKIPCYRYYPLGRILGRKPDTNDTYPKIFCFGKNFPSLNKFVCQNDSTESSQIKNFRSNFKRVLILII